jgi:hypothetical protein
MLMLHNFLPGAITMGFAFCALFFLRFWRTTRDRLFLGFSLAFFLLGTGQALLGSWVTLTRPHVLAEAPEVLATLRARLANFGRAQ